MKDKKEDKRSKENESGAEQRSKFMIFLTYLFFGGVATLIDWGTFSITLYIGFHYLLSLTLSFSLGSITNFSLNKYFNFKNKYKNVPLQFLIYLIIAIGGLTISMLMMLFAVEILQAEKVPARIIITFLMLAYNYAGHTLITFSKFK